VIPYPAGLGLTMDVQFHLGVLKQGWSQVGDNHTLSFFSAIFEPGHG